MAKWQATVPVVTEMVLNMERTNRGPNDPIEVLNVEIDSAYRGQLCRWPIHTLDNRAAEDPSPKPIWTAIAQEWGGENPPREISIPGFFETQQMALDGLVVHLATRTETVKTVKAWPPPWSFREPFDALLSQAVRRYSTADYNELLDQLCDLAAGRTP